MNGNPAVHKKYKEVFRLYQTDSWASELIVRVAQVLVTTGNHDATQRSFPELLAYFQNYFLPECTKYLCEFRIRRAFMASALDETTPDHNFTVDAALPSVDDDAPADGALSM